LRAVITEITPENLEIKKDFELADGCFITSIGGEEGVRESNCQAD
jgi:hypothetical protein